MTVNRLKKLVIALIALPLLAMVVVPNAVSVPTGAAADDQDAATVYKAKCTLCHGAKAEKKFDPSIPEDQLVEIVLKGKKVEKPPHMPAYGEKGITAEQAKALVNYMKELKGASEAPK